MNAAATNNDVNDGDNYDDNGHLMQSNPSFYFFSLLHRSEVIGNLSDFDSSSVIDLFNHHTLSRQQLPVHQEVSDDDLSIERIPVPWHPAIASRSSASLSRNAASSLSGIGTAFNRAMWLSGRPMLLVAEVRGSIPAKHRGWSRR